MSTNSGFLITKLKCTHIPFFVIVGFMMQNGEDVFKIPFVPSGKKTPFAVSNHNRTFPIEGSPNVTFRKPSLSKGFVAFEGDESELALPLQLTFSEEWIDTNTGAAGLVFELNNL